MERAEAPTANRSTVRAVGGLAWVRVRPGAVERHGESFAAVRPAGEPYQSIRSRPCTANSLLIRLRGFPEQKKYRGTDGCPLSTMQRFLCRSLARRLRRALINRRSSLAGLPNSAMTTALSRASSTSTEMMRRVIGCHNRLCQPRCPSTACHEVPRQYVPVSNTLMVGVRLIQSTPCPVRFSNMARGGGSTTWPSCNPRRSISRRSQRSPESNRSPSAPGSSAAAAQTRPSKLGVTRPGSARSSIHPVRSPCSKERPVARHGSGYGSLPMTTAATSEGSMPSNA